MQLIVISRGISHTVLISDEDADLAQYRWHLAGGKGPVGKYVARPVKKQTVYLHRVVAERLGIAALFEGVSQGHWRNSIDHINGNKLDNQRTNLRRRTRPEQMSNLNDELRTTNKSGHRGVTFARERAGKKPWLATVMVNYRTINLGYYATVEEAAAARQQWEDTPPEQRRLPEPRKKS